MYFTSNQFKITFYKPLVKSKQSAMKTRPQLFTGMFDHVTVRQFDVNFRSGPPFWCVVLWLGGIRQFGAFQGRSRRLWLYRKLEQRLWQRLVTQKWRKHYQRRLKKSWMRILLLKWARRDVSCDCISCDLSVAVPVLWLQRRLLRF